MAEKKCKYCAMVIPEEAKICPYCRKKQSSTFLKFIAGFFLLLLFASFIGQIDKGTHQQNNAEKARDGRFIAYDNETVLDTMTNLMWADRDNVSSIHWYDAKSYCENYRGGGYTDWRMPTVEELGTLYVERQFRYPACGHHDLSISVATKLIDITCFGLWATTSGFNAAGFSFITGSQGWGPQDDSSMVATGAHYRCVLANRLFDYLVYQV